MSLRFSSDEKEYICKMRLGIITDTQDGSGKVTATASTDGITQEKLKEALLVFKGRQKQLPPMISAKHHKGKRLYQLARKGMERIYSLSIE